jgi:hypothetical protein
MSDSSNSNFVCFQCHNGIGALSYIKDTILTPAAVTVTENETAECMVCHNPHRPGGQKENTAGTSTDPTDPDFGLGTITTDTNIRLPEELSFSPDLASEYRVFTFLDGTRIPTRIENGIICAYCHQGRSSGLILNSTKFGLSATSRSRSFANDHYLAAGAVLWARNAYEYLNRSYTRDIAHNNGENNENGNCFGCHMNNSNTGSAGGHTWKMVSDAGVQNVAACNVAGCHDGGAAGGPVTNFQTFNPFNVDYDGDGVVQGVAQEIGGLVLNVRGAPTDGLLGDLVAVMEARGFQYNPNSYPYFFKSTGAATTPSDWTNLNLAAAFNLNMLVKTVYQFSPLAAGGFKGGVDIHNPFYEVQILDDSLQSLEPTTSTVLGVARFNSILANRPVGTSPATVYGAKQLTLP